MNPHKTYSLTRGIAAGALLSASLAFAAQPTTLFEDEFTGGIPGWTAVQPAGGAYIDGPMLWEYDANTHSFSEQSNLYTDGAGSSITRIATMLINDTVAPASFSYTARLTAGDDDGFGLIWGYQNEDTFYRLYFGRQNRTAGWPYTGWGVDRMFGGQITDLFGAGTPGYVQTFVNTANQPFDVSIGVTNGRLTVVVIDNPDLAPVPYNLVTDELLPSAPSGQVGIFSWGMAGGNPRSFRVQNPALLPTPLTGDPAGTVLTNWSFLITPRGSDGTVPVVNNTPIWAQGLSLDGDRGTMIENSDWLADNTGAATTNFAAPTAVAGDVNWTNYIYTARLISRDNDGFGVLLRYKDETNFYRIAFRQQNSTSGVKRGISIQKNVDLVFDEVFSSSAFLPPVNVPMDVHSSISGNRLQVMIVSDPLSATPQANFFGPFDISGGTVDNGKIGVFSWAQNNEAAFTTTDAGTETDYVRVRHVAGEGLFVNSAYGNPNPAVGLGDYPLTTVITASVENVVISQPGVRRVNTGWVGAGSVPSTGATNEVVFTLSTLSSINWNWKTEYLLTTSAGAGGTVSANAGPWVDAGSNVTVTATANPGYIFTGWSGDLVSTLTNLAFVMNRPITLTANFALDSDSDLLPDSWELLYFNNLAQTGTDDPDNDDADNASEYQRGTNPNHAETLIASDGLSSNWINPRRDPALPGQFRVVDFGSGYRGVFEDSNDYRWANDATFVVSSNLADYASFQGPRMVIRPELWTDSWGSNFSASVEFTVGDDDGNCLYFRYVDEDNWFRVTTCGQTETTLRARLGVSIQRRVDGTFSEVAFPDPGIIPDPSDFTGYKRMKVTVSATNDSFEVRAIGWNWAINDFDAFSERITSFSDTNHPAGRIGVGFWGQGALVAGQSFETNGIPVPLGAFADNLVVRSPADGAIVFSDNWDTAALEDEFPAGWTNVFAGDALEADWTVSAHGSIAQQSNVGEATTGDLFAPKADVDGPVLLAPDQMSANYLLQFGIHSFDDDGVGFVYDFQDTNNYSRVMFVSQDTADGRIPQGLSVSRKSGGVWTDIVAGDNSFVYTPGQPFEVDFANNNGNYDLVVRPVDDPGNFVKWHWTAPAAAAQNRFGVAVWAAQDIHFLYARAYDLPTIVSLEITDIEVSGGNVTLTVSKPPGSSYDVLRASAVTGPYSPVATNQSGDTFMEALPGGSSAFYRLQLVP